ncbi:cytochrome P450 [Auriculariales sp. MPI-PUGE-AT-0066]|nr:cytochrome P450 [Auriculariales sp. MPI-PUGE-AT-0066]
MSQILPLTTVCAQHPFAFLAAAVVAVTVFNLLSVRRQLKAIGFHPGVRLLITPLVPYPIPNIEGICWSPGWWYRAPYKPFEKARTDVISCVSLFPPRVSYLLADPVALKEWNRSRASFTKPPKLYNKVEPFGRNIVSAEGADYKRRRGPAQSSFTERNNKFTFEASLSIAQKLFSSRGWRNKDVVECKDVADMMERFALRVIAVAGFGQDIVSEENDAAATEVRLEHAFQVVSDHLMTLILVPRWLYPIIPSLRPLAKSYAFVLSHIHVMMHERRTSPDVVRSDLFSGLLGAADEASAAGKGDGLTDDELIADIVTFLVAGHETTAHALAFALALLAMHPVVQEKMYKDLQPFVSSDGDIAYNDIPKLSYTLAVFYEATRLHPPIFAYTKGAVRSDVTLPTASGEPIVVPEGTWLSAHVNALHYNPKCWPNPEIFKPERFLDPEWPRDAFVAFSSGPRACIGRRFAETEAVTFLATIIAQYRVELPPDFNRQAPGARSGAPKPPFKFQLGLTAKPCDLHLVFRRRSGPAKVI